jgi:DNA-binding transcriptional ArsR family regulator
MTTDHASLGGEAPVSGGDAVLVLDFDEISVLDLADLLAALNDIAVRATIAWLRGHVFSDSRPAGAGEEQIKDALEILASSYCASAQREGEAPIGAEHHALWGAFDYGLSDRAFAKWVAASLREFSLTTVSIKEGNSVEVALGFAAIAALTNLPLDYSLIKDVVTYAMKWLLSGIRKPRPRDTLGSVAVLLEAVGRIRGIKQCRLRIDGVEIDLFVEVRRHRRHSA